MPNTKPDVLVQEINLRAFDCPAHGCEVERVVRVADVYKIVSAEVARQAAALTARAEHIEREGRPHIPAA